MVKPSITMMKPSITKMSNLFIGIIIGTPLGIAVERAWLRALHHQMAYIKRQMRGGTKRRKRRLWADSGAPISGVNGGGRSKGTSRNDASSAADSRGGKYRNSGVCTNGEKIDGPRRL